MHLKLFLPLYGVLALLHLGRADEPPSQPAPLAVGILAPSFKTHDAQGVERNLETLKGKKNLLLTFFPRCFTNRCSIHLASLRDSYRDLQKADIEVWAVSVDPAGGERGQKAFADSLKLPFPLIPDTKRDICLLFGAVQSRAQTAKRVSVFIDKKGMVRWIDTQIDPETHGLDVLKRWREVNKESPAAK